MNNAYKKIKQRCNPIKNQKKIIYTTINIPEDVKCSYIEFKKAKQHKYCKNKVNDSNK